MTLTLNSEVSTIVIAIYFHINGFIAARIYNDVTEDTDFKEFDVKGKFNAVLFFVLLLLFASPVQVSYKIVLAIEWVYRKLNNLTQLEFWVLYVFNRKKLVFSYERLRQIDKESLPHKNTNSISHRTYRLAVRKLFKINNYTGE